MYRLMMERDRKARRRMSCWLVSVLNSLVDDLHLDFGLDRNYPKQQSTRS